MQLALEQPEMARFMLSIAVVSRVWDERIRPYVLADLLLGIKRKRFKVASNDAAMDLITGTNYAAIRNLLNGTANRAHIVAVAASILRGLGVSPREADEVARRPLPPLPDPRALTCRDAGERR